MCSLDLQIIETFLSGPEVELMEHVQPRFICLLSGRNEDDVAEHEEAKNRQCVRPHCVPQFKHLRAYLLGTN